MSFYHGRLVLARRFHLIHASFLEKDGLPFAEVLPEQRIEEVFAEAGVQFPEDETCVYTPAVTLWAFLSQTLAKGELRSCMMAVSRVLVLLVAMGREPCSKNTGAYCRARAKLPEAVIERLAVEVARGCEEQAPPQWLWCGRHVLLGDGTTVSMADTDLNQAEYPQHNVQAEGLGFPIARMVVLLSLATGMLWRMAMGSYSGKETGETALLRELLAGVDPRTILLTDRYYCGYFLIALVLLGQRDFITRLHQGRKTDFRKAQRLGKGDWMVEWTRRMKKCQPPNLGNIGRRDANEPPSLSIFGGWHLCLLPRSRRPRPPKTPMPGRQRRASCEIFSSEWKRRRLVKPARCSKSGSTTRSFCTKPRKWASPPQANRMQTSYIRTTECRLA